MPYLHIPVAVHQVKPFLMCQFLVMERRLQLENKMAIKLSSFVVVHLPQGHNAVSQGADF